MPRRCRLGHSAWPAAGGSPKAVASRDALGNLPEQVSHWTVVVDVSQASLVLYRLGIHGSGGVSVLGAHLPFSYSLELSRYDFDARGLSIEHPSPHHIKLLGYRGGRRGVTEEELLAAGPDCREPSFRTLAEPALAIATRPTSICMPWVAALPRSREKVEGEIRPELQHRRRRHRPGESEGDRSPRR